MALRRLAAWGPRIGLVRRLLGAVLVVVGLALWVVAARSFGLGHASVGVVLAGALVAAGVALLLSSL